VLFSISTVLIAKQGVSAIIARRSALATLQITQQEAQGLAMRANGLAVEAVWKPCRRQFDPSQAPLLTWHLCQSAQTRSWPVRWTASRCQALASSHASFEPPTTTPMLQP
jgi:hypothetical protein